MVIVFLVLVVLWGILNSMRVFFSRKNKPQINQKDRGDGAAPIAIKAEDMASDDIGAVISAAIAACTGNKSNLVVTKISRASENAPIWNQIGRHEQALNRL
jgi:sodium pump decarboxylase gamma subunit